MAYVRTRLGRWFYEERGKAKRAGDPPILLLHGVLFDGGMWRGQVESLAALGRVIVIDGPGHGKSEAPPRFSLEDHADALAIDAFNELKIPKAILIGHSWGGMVAMRAAIQHPMQVAALALVDASAEPESLTDKVKNRAMVSFGRRYGLPRWLIDSEVAPRLFGPKTLRERPEIVDAFARTVNGYDRDGLARAALAVVVHRIDVTAKLRGVAAPTLVICGKQDNATVPAKSEALAAKIHGAKLEWVEDSGHMSPIEQPAVVARLLEAFVRERLAAR
jgi:pimeloyl-ACP methyl ester carboxylesterase